MAQIGLVQIHGAVLLFGLAGLFAKVVPQPALTIVLGRVFFATLFLAMVLLIRRQRLRLDHGMDYLALAAQGVILAIHWWTFFKSIQVSTVAVGLITFSTFPVFVTFLEPLLLKERFRFSGVFIAMVTLGGVILVIPEFVLGNRVTQGALWGIASGLTFAILSVLNRKYVGTYSSLVVAFYQDAAATLVLLPFLAGALPAVSGRDLGLLVLLGVVFTGIAHSLFIQGLATVRAHTASIVACLEPVYGIAAAGLLLGEIPSARVLVGGAIILGCTWYATVAPAHDASF
ncbi:MAG: EamA family transporter [Desulfobacterales bacterium]|nr:EamA family transporter [Desulfobacterales bacterium]